MTTPTPDITSRLEAIEATLAAHSNHLAALDTRAALRSWEHARLMRELEIRKRHARVDAKLHKADEA